MASYRNAAQFGRMPFPRISAMPGMSMPKIGGRGYGMMAGGAALIGGAAMLSHRHRQRAKSSGGMM